MLRSQRQQRRQNSQLCSCPAQSWLRGGYLVCQPLASDFLGRSSHQKLGNDSGGRPVPSQGSLVLCLSLQQRCYSVWSREMAFQLSLDPGEPRQKLGMLD